LPEFIDQRPQRIDQSQVIQQRRPQVVGDAAFERDAAGQALAQARPALRNQRSRLGRQLAFDPVGVELAA
jgi:hypothetical protein